ncbi:FKBP-type peptidyl-prolyl cis-trans isomerase [Agarilytica rhodophyticola]|uniref:FKBP-type peptidyl-prolyl cis-trans isomerase n=1 Tax=Agarilytica rhodophyticola TaxID=1737490 RepID=UPI000B342099|nr:FKBP-type peptidyl-prolyl cis-trans isomerase [Agarilytica rhodophyticola]
MSDKYKTAGQRASYGIGRQMGSQLAAQSFDGVDPSAVAEGVIDALKGNASVLSEDEINTAFGEIEKQMQAKAQQQGEVLSKEGAAFLAENAKREEVTVLDSGLQYEVITAAEGDKPSLQSTVRTHYHGTLINGEVFDSSVQRGQPAEFPVNGVIAGWTEALQLMAVGSKWRLFVPSNLAYGERGAGGKIGPNATLVFEVELLAIV